MTLILMLEQGVKPYASSERTWRKSPENYTWFCNFLIFFFSPNYFLHTGVAGYDPCIEREEILKKYILQPLQLQGEGPLKHPLK